MKSNSTVKLPSDENIRVSANVKTGEILDDRIEIRKEREHSKTSQKWIIHLSVLVVIGLISLLILRVYLRPTQVDFVQPKNTVITETIANSGRDGGITNFNKFDEVRRLLI